MASDVENLERTTSAVTYFAVVAHARRGTAPAG
jgi:hypothetical protein